MRFKSALVALLAVVAAAAFCVPAYADGSSANMYRLYNPNSGEHFYTSSQDEAMDVASAGWDAEGIGWVAPRTSSAPVYRLYNPNAGDHHYTLSAEERDGLVKLGWNYEGVGWYSDTANSIAVYRQYNPNAIAGAHNFTTSAEEDVQLGAAGWKREGVAWYALGTGGDLPADSPIVLASNKAIMGESKASASVMAAYYRSKGASYPSAAFAAGGAPSIDDFAAIVSEEAAAEGVRAEVVFCQAMWETGWLQYGGDVDAGQYNFAGLGATGGGAKGASFPDVRTGIRAQVQHLKAYASTAPLNNECVDPRFHLVSRGVAPTLPDLNGRWAVPGEGYGESIMGLIAQMLS